MSGFPLEKEEPLGQVTIKLQSQKKSYGDVQRLCMPDTMPFTLNFLSRRTPTAQSLNSIPRCKFLSLGDQNGADFIIPLHLIVHYVCYV